MKKLLVICGPTASGKTKIAIGLAKKFNGEIVSADSRQVYKGMDIGTGKDLPAKKRFVYVNSKIGGFYLINGVKVWGYDLVEPTDDFSVSEYVYKANNIIQNIIYSKKLPILVGGTGLYIKGILDGIATSHIKRNIKLRKQIQSLNAEALYEKLSQMDPLKAASMNYSDKNNPRRLTRAIEIADANIKKDAITPLVQIKYNSLIIGLKTDDIKGLIKKRVDKRFKQGILVEVKKLLDSGVNWDMQSMSAMGYKQWRNYLSGEKTLDESMEEWVQSETKYFRRQMTWFKKDKRILWFSTNEPNQLIKLENTVKKWYDAN